MLNIKIIHVLKQTIMNKLIKTAMYALLATIFALPLFVGCSPGADKAKSLPKNGSMCLQSEKTKAEFIQLEFKDGVVEGKIFMDEGQNGKVYYMLKGQVLSDTVLQVSIAYATDDISRDWVVHTSGDKMSIAHILDRQETSVYSIVDCSAAPPASDYASLADLEKNAAPDYDEDVPSTCFECTYPGGNKRIVFREYIQLWNSKGQVSGKGAGYSEGDPEWSFTFSGTLTNDTVLELKASYMQDGLSPFSTSETWFVNLEKGSIRLKEAVPASLRAISNGEYHKVACDYVPEDLRNLMNRPSN